MVGTRLVRALVIVTALVVLGAACGDDSGGGGDAAEPESGGGTTTEPESGATEAGRADCLAGEWVLDPASYVDGFGSYLDGLGGLSVGDVSGDMRIAIGDDGLTATFSDWTVVLVIDAGSGETRSTTNGEVTGDLSVDDGVITVTEIAETLDTTGTFTVDGVELDPAMGGFDVGAVAEPNFFVTPVPFTCEGDRLDLETAPPESASFIVSYDRVS